MRWYFIWKTIPSRNICYCITQPATGTFQRVTLRLVKTKSRQTIREIWEETSITGIEFLDGFRMKIEYKYRHGKQLVRKEVVLYLIYGRARAK